MTSYIRIGCGYVLFIKGESPGAFPLHHVLGMAHCTVNLKIRSVTGFPPEHRHDFVLLDYIGTPDSRVFSIVFQILQSDHINFNG